MTNPFEGIENHAAHTPAELRSSLLADARRGYAPLRKVFIQQPSGADTRASILGDMVNRRQETALRLLLLTVALEPVEGLTLSPGRWASMLAANHKPCSHPQLTRAILHLEQRHLIRRVGTNRLFGLTPLFEDGSGTSYTRPTAEGAAVGKGFFVIPHDLWDTGLIDRLRLAGLAMFLVCLHDTHQHPAFQVTLERMPLWYGISERTAERGYHELDRQGILLTHAQTVPDRRAAAGIRTVTWRALDRPYSKEARESLQAIARSRVMEQAKAAKKNTKRSTSMKSKKKAGT